MIALCNERSSDKSHSERVLGLLARDDELLASIRDLLEETLNGPRPAFRGRARVHLFGALERLPRTIDWTWLVALIETRWQALEEDFSFVRFDACRYEFDIERPRVFGPLVTRIEFGLRVYDVSAGILSRMLEFYPNVKEFFFDLNPDHPLDFVRELPDKIEKLGLCGLCREFVEFLSVLGESSVKHLYLEPEYGFRASKSGVVPAGIAAQVRQLTIDCESARNFSERSSLPQILDQHWAAVEELNLNFFGVSVGFFSKVIQRENFPRLKRLRLCYSNLYREPEFHNGWGMGLFSCQLSELLVKLQSLDAKDFSSWLNFFGPETLESLEFRTNRAGRLEDLRALMKRIKAWKIPRVTLVFFRVEGVPDLAWLESMAFPGLNKLMIGFAKGREFGTEVKERVVEIERRMLADKQRFPQLASACLLASVNAKGGWDNC